MVSGKTVESQGAGVWAGIAGMVLGFVALTLLVVRAPQTAIVFLPALLSVLAILFSALAIVRSCAAERSAIRKSDEMSAALERVEAAVERIGGEIADTIYDNFEMLAEEIQESLPSRDVLRADVTEAVEHSLAEAVIVVEGQTEEKSVQPEEPVAEAVPVVVEKATEVPPEPEAVQASVEAEPVAPPPVTDEAREKADKKYGEFKDIVLLGVANYPGVIARKVGEGQYRTEGDELADGVFIIQNEKVAVCTFCTGDALIDRFLGETGDSFNGFLRSLVNEFKRGHFSRVFLVFDGQLSNSSPYAKALNGLNGRIDSDLFSRFELFEGTPSVVIPELTERVSQLMEEVPAGGAEDVPEISFRRQASA
jgi:cell division septation protein DedD